MVPLLRSGEARCFCAHCGTPLFFDVPEADFINITLGSLDDPTTVKPVEQANLDSKMPWFAELDRLPVEDGRPVRTGWQGRREPASISIPTTTQQTGRWTGPNIRDRPMTDLRSLYPKSSRSRRIPRRRRWPCDLLRAGRHKGAKPAVFLHGGPGGGINANQRRIFDPRTLRRDPV